MDLESDSIDLSHIRRTVFGESWPSFEKINSIGDEDASQKHEDQLTVDSKRPNVEKNAPVEDLSQHLAVKNVESIGVESPTHQPRTIIFESHEAQRNPALERISKQGKLAKGRMMGDEENDPNDTQPLSQSVYETFISKGKSILEASKDTTFPPPEAQHSVPEQDSARVDIVSSFKPHDELAGDDQQQDEDATSEIYDFSPTQTQAPLPPIPNQSQRFKTPGTVGKKRDFLGRTIERTPAQNTPKNLNPFASASKSGGVPVMGLSQIFQATQAVSSPLLNLRSDPSDRPSPNFEINARIGTDTSPLSPIKPMPPFRRSITEPSANYISMKSSQAERQRLASTEDRQDEVSDDGFEDESSLFERQQRQKELDRRVKEQLAGLGKLKHMSEPLQDQVQKDNAHDDADDAPLTPRQLASSPDGMDSEPEKDAEITDNETEQETDHEDVPARRFGHTVRGIASEEDKENLETAIQVPRTSAKLQQLFGQTIESSPLSNRGPVQHSLNSTPGGQPEDGLIGHVAIADSQRSQHEDDKNRTTLRNNLHATSSAGDIVIPQSQIQESTFVPASSPERSVPVAGELGRPHPLLQDHSQHHTTEPDDEPTPGSKPRSSETEEIVQQRSTIDETNSPGAETKSDTESGKLTHKLSSRQRSNKNSHSESSSKYETAHSELPPKSSRPGILSSPGGQSRKRMLDIQMEPSPQDFTGGEIDVDLGITTVDDEIFKEIVGGSSPIPPGRRTKRQRMQPREEPEPSHLASSQTTMDPMPTDHYIKDGVSSIVSAPRIGRHSKLSSIKENEKRSRDVWDVTTTPPEQPVHTHNRVHNSRRQQRSEMQKVDEADKMEQPLEDATITVSSPNVNPTNSLPVVAEKDPNLSPRGDEDINNTNGPVTHHENIIRPDRIFACFNGKARAYYPARCLALTSNEPLRYRIQWEGFEPDEIDGHGVRRLELRIGDAVKVNLEGFPKVPYVVKGFKDQVADDSETAVTDIYGHKLLLLGPKQRKGAPVDLGSEKSFEVPMSNIYLDNNMWAQFKDREFSFTKQQYQSTPGFATPLDRASTPSSPQSRSRRDKAPLELVMEDADSGPFQGIIFAVSIDDSEKRSTLSDTIRKQGGVILEDGFEELFETTSLNVHSPTRRKTDGVTQSLVDLSLRSSYEDMSFAVLITDDFSRKTKYMQALALGIPCLHWKWIEGCMAHGRVIDWNPYLLAAGRSVYLDNAVKSRVIKPIDPMTSKLRDIILDRPKPLDGESVVFVLGRSKADEKRKAYLLLIRAMGAHLVERAHDLKGAKALVEDDQSLAWIVVDDKELAVAKSMFEGQTKKKRKFSGTQNTVPRIVGTDFIAQSLILGKLLGD